VQSVGVANQLGKPPFRRLRIDMVRNRTRRLANRGKETENMSFHAQRGLGMAGFLGGGKYSAAGRNLSTPYCHAAARRLNSS
jgi:hypothetical protein